MGDFFRGWRRKVGVVTLVMACVLMAGWVRSFVMADTLGFLASKSSYGVWSTNGGLGCSYVYAKEGRVDKRHFRRNSVKIAKFSVTEFTGNLLNLDLGEFHLNIGTQTWGHYTDLVQTPGPAVSCLLIVAQVPYWSVVIPLTLISAFFLLSKPRKSTQKKIAEPVPENVE